MKSQSYRDLLVWQKSIELCMKVYEACRAFPRSGSHRGGVDAGVARVAHQPDAGAPTRLRTEGTGPLSERGDQVNRHGA